MGDVLASYLLANWAYDPASGDVFGVRGVRIGVLTKDGYLQGQAKINGKYRNVFLHRAAWLLTHGRWPSGPLDHRDGDKSNNRIANLRDAGAKINAQNLRRAHRDKKAPIAGAYRRGNRWQAIIRVDGIARHLGMFSSAEDAHQAYLAAKRKFHPGCSI